MLLWPLMVDCVWVCARALLCGAVCAVVYESASVRGCVRMRVCERECVCPWVPRTSIYLFHCLIRPPIARLDVVAAYKNVLKEKQALEDSFSVLTGRPESPASPPPPVSPVLASSQEASHAGGSPSSDKGAELALAPCGEEERAPTPLATPAVGDSGAVASLAQESGLQARVPDAREETAALELKVGCSLSRGAEDVLIGAYARRWRRSPSHCGR